MEELERVFQTIREERHYQDEIWPESKNLPTTGEISLLRSYLNEFDENYRSNDNSPNSDVPEECLHGLRKMATILCRAIQNHGVRFRVEDIS